MTSLAPQKNIAKGTDCDEQRFGSKTAHRITIVLRFPEHFLIDRIAEPQFLPRVNITAEKQPTIFIIAGRYSGQQPPFAFYHQRKLGDIVDKIIIGHHIKIPFIDICCRPALDGFDAIILCCLGNGKLFAQGFPAQHIISPHMQVTAGKNHYDHTGINHLAADNILMLHLV